MTTVTTRFAPSPTGYLHIGGARTALFNWLLARKHSGRFVLRIEDTDRARSTDESLRKILDDLRWLGLDWDEGPDVGGPNGPYFQSQRLDIYRRYVEQLIDAGRAHKCFETPEELSAQRQAARAAGRRYKYQPRSDTQGDSHVVMFCTDERDVTVTDEILGSVTFPADQLEDFVILKSDGYPTYHLAVVVDDHLMGITNVLRGQEHLMNTPKHIALQQALGFAAPLYAHMPLIFNMDGSKMSKRDKEKASKKGLAVPEIDVHDFRAAGYLPHALLNFISLLGWSPGGDREFMTLNEMIELFSIQRIGKTNARFDRDKLAAFNAHYIRQSDNDHLKHAVSQWFDVVDCPLKTADDATLERIFDLYRERSRTLTEISQASTFFLTDTIEYDPKAVKKVLAKDGARTVLVDICELLGDIDDWTASCVEQRIEQYCSEKQLKLGKVAQPIRVAVSGTTVSPPIYETLELLGRDKTLTRIRQAIDLIASVDGA